MGFFFRKSFRVGPARLNLSKSGLGVSTGVKGARVGVGTRGAYLAAGLKGIYYRKRLGGAASASGAEPQISTAAAIVIWLVMLTVGAIVAAMVAFVLWLIW